MQTFLPFPSFADSGAVLDRARLGKQRVETFQIVQRLLGERLVTGEKDADGRMIDWPEPQWRREPIATGGWDHHPAKLMWEGSELVLYRYQKAICGEWTSRGYRDSTLRKTEFLLEPHWSDLGEAGADENPSWLGDEDFHLSHRSNLLRKDPGYYLSAFGPIPLDLPYVWPQGKESLFDGTSKKLI